MPNFNTHWLVAIKCLESSALPASIKDGYDKYCAITEEYKNKLTKLIDAVVDRKTIKEFIDTKLDDWLREYNDKLTNEKNHNDITCFSAYALGACGPDFWMVPSKSKKLNLLPHFAGIHFDLGHYNRSHRQFQIAIKRWENVKVEDYSLQIKAEQAYFYGMATHIATDCVVHQLVNVYAGAYHVLDSNWENQHGSLPANIWSPHNKVEHFWDSYIRYEYLGDINSIFGENSKENDENQLMTPLGFPTVEKYCEPLEKELKQPNKTKNSLTKSENLTQRSLSIEEKTALIEALKDNKTKIEKAFILPRIFCDRVIDNGDKTLEPFLHEIIVKKEKGAYESEIIFEGAIEESTSFQFQIKGSENLNENKKLSYFASKSNSDKTIPNLSFNYLNYIVCPDLKTTGEFGWNNFYHTNSLKPFIKSAELTSKKFLTAFDKAVKNKTPENLGILGSFWNLDTGHGIQVENIESDTPKEVITQLKFIHVTDTEAQLPEVKNWRDEKKSGNYKYLEKLTGLPYPKPKKGFRVFDTYKGDEFDSSNVGYANIVENDMEKYFDKIRLTPQINTFDTKKDIDSFFNDDKKQKSESKNVSTEKAKNKKNILTADYIKHRLTLKIQMPIAELSDNEPLGFYLHKDKDNKLGIKDSILHNGKKNQLKGWLKNNTEVTDFTETMGKDEESCRFFRKDGLCFFETQILLNLGKEEDLKRKIAKASKEEKESWNNES